VRLAAIDLGTNTVRLLVVEVDAAHRWHPLVESQRITRLGEGLAVTGRLGAAPMDRTEATVVEYVAVAERGGAGVVLIVGTSAMREAANGPAFAARIEARTGRRVRIVTGDEEARLTLLGVRHGLGDLGGAVVVFDIGGGSTEFVRGSDRRVEASVSLRLGVVLLAEQAWSADDLARHVEARVRRELPPSIAGTGVDCLVGTAGTVTTLAALDLGLDAYDAARVHGHVLTRAAIERQRERLAPLGVEEIARLPCLERGRADLIRPGVAITLAVVDTLRIGSLVVSETGLREGIMAEALG
jgi:exopolyphosphatase/guanosine-5'-triphosphate,3'-diphosphate pyrophosphatase